ncbi:GNAT family N-acetyltransferase [Kitasatospora sp. NPDC054939]
MAKGGFTVEGFRGQIGGHARKNGFTLVTAHEGDDPVPLGFGYGFLCTPENWFGSGLLAVLDSPVTAVERLAGVCDLAVLPGRQGRGTGTAIHGALLDGLGAAWSSLTVMPGADRPERRLYHRLGYRYAGPYESRPGGPVLDLLLLHRDAPGVSAR